MELRSCHSEPVGHDWVRAGDVYSDRVARLSAGREVLFGLGMTHGRTLLEVQPILTWGPGSPARPTEPRHSNLCPAS